MKKKLIRERTVTIVMVTLIALAIWLYAENQSIEAHPNFAIDIQLVVAQDLIIDKPMRNPKRISINFTCAQSQYDGMRQLVQKGPLKIDVTHDPNNVDQQLIVSELLNSQDAIRELRITIDKAEPATLNVRVERMVVKILPIEVDPGDFQLLATPTVQPTTATVRIPETLFEAVENQNIVATARLSSLTEQLQVNELVERAITLDIPNELRDYTPDPAKVKVSFTLKKVTKQYTVPNLPIMIEAPLATLNEYRVKLAEDQQVIRDVILEGPNDIIEKIENGQIQVSAVLRLTTADLTSQPPVTSKLLHIKTPDLVTVKRNEFPRVKFQIIKITPSTATTGS